MINKIYTSLHIAFARDLRKKQTPTEVMMWQQLRNRRFLGLKFLRQHPIVTDSYNSKTGFYIADFIVRKKNW